MTEQLDPEIQALFERRPDLAKRFQHAQERLVGWFSRDPEAVGRILRAHLVVEFHLERYIAARNPNLGDISDLRFAQKIVLASAPGGLFENFREVVAAINSIRNSFARTLEETPRAKHLESVMKFIRAHFSPERCESLSPVEAIELAAGAVAGGLLAWQLLAEERNAASRG